MFSFSNIKHAALAALLAATPLAVLGQQNVVNNLVRPSTGAADSTGLAPIPEKPAFGAVIDYDQYQQLTNIPTLYLTCKPGVTLDYSKKTETYYDATIVLVDQHGTIKQRNEDVTFRGRGNATWNSGSAKKPWRLKFPNKTSLLTEYDLATGKEVKNFADAKSWTLLANHFDKSMIRNAVTYELGKLIGLPFCPAYKFVDLVLNGEYYGTYQISDHMEVAKKRVFVRNKDLDWMIELCDGMYGEDPEFSAGGYHFNVKSPEDDATIAAMQAYMTQVMNTVSAKSDLSKYMDIKSLADYMIGVDVSGNYDGAKGNNYCYRGTEDTDLLKWGPIWDLDLGYGNIGGWASASDIEHKHMWQIQGEWSYMSPFFVNIYNSVEFQKHFYPRWKKLYDAGLATKLNAKVDEIYNEVKNSAIKNYVDGGHNTGYNTEKWSMGTSNMGLTYTNSHDPSVVATDYKQSVDDIKAFLSEHIKWLNEQYAKDYQTITGLDPKTAVEPEDENNPVDPGTTEDPTDDSHPGALVVNADGTYTFTGSAASFKVGAEIKILTEDNNATVSTLIGGNAWKNEKSITLTDEDVNVLKAADYTFTISTNNAVKAITVKAPAAKNGLSEGTPGNWGSIVYTYVGDQSSMSEGAKFNITLDGSNPYFKAYTTDENSSLWNAWGAGAGPKNYTYDVTAAQAQTLASNSYKLYISVNEGTCTSASFIGNSSGSSEEKTPTRTLSLTASEGGTVSGAGTYDENTTVIIKAVAADGFKFKEWSDGNTLASRSVTLTTEDMTLTATFVAEGDTPGDDDSDPFNEKGEHQQLTNLPTIYLNATIDDDWSGATLEVFDKDNKLGQGTVWTKTTADVSVQFQGSGDKNKDSYRLKFESKTKLLASGKFKQWVLLANDDDPSLMRNALAKEMGDALGLPFTPGYQFVDLYVNNTYMGTYQVTDRVKAEDGRALVTGGNKDLDWHVRLNDETEYKEDLPQYYIAGTETMPYIIPKNPDPKDDDATWNSSLENEMTTYFQSLFAKTDDHYTAFADGVDKQQLIQWYVAQEILCVYKGFSSIEAYRSVAATDKDLHIGVIWDSEKSMGNLGEAPALNMSDLSTKDSYRGLMTNYAAYGLMKDIFADLWTQSWFANGVKSLWNEKHEAVITAMTAKASALATELTESQAKNAEKWSGSLGSHANYTAAVDAISTYLTERDAYLTTKFAALAALVPCDNHTYNNKEYVQIADGTYRRACDNCGAAEVGDEAQVYYLFNVYVQNKDLTGTSGYTTDAEWPSHQTEYTKPNTLFYVDAAGLTGTNVISKGVCDHFVLTDGVKLAIKTKFVAKEATYTRTMSADSQWGTVCVPFKLEENDDVKLYALSKATIEGETGSMTFATATKTGGSVPLTFRKVKANATSVTFTGSKQEDGTITVKATDGITKNTSSEVPAGWAFYGNVTKQQTLTFGTDFAGNDIYYIASDKFWQAGGTVDVSPFRAVFTYPVSDGAAASRFRISVEDTEGIEELLAEPADAVIYDLNGRHIPAQQPLRPGMYIIGNEKIFIK